MPRGARKLGIGHIYHVLNRGNSGQTIFYKDEDYAVFIKLMKEAKRKFQIKLFSYSIMPTHFHMLVKQMVEKALSKFMQWLLTTHVRRYHKHYGSSGHIWQDRFKSFLVEEDDHFITVMRYIEGNPVRAGFVRSARDWKWSSHLETIGKKSRDLVDEPPVKLPGDWSNFVDTPMTPKELERIRRSVNRQSPFGEKQWEFEMVKRYKLRSTIRPRGRPSRRKRYKYEN